MPNQHTLVYMSILGKYQADIKLALVAQLDVRPTGDQEVEGSIPARDSIFLKMSHAQHLPGTEGDRIQNITTCTSALQSPMRSAL